LRDDDCAVDEAEILTDVRSLLAAAGHELQGDRGRVVEALGVLALSGERPSLSAAAKAAGVPKGTALAWNSRHPAFTEAVRFWQDTPAPVAGGTLAEAYARRISGEPDNPVPSFLDFRERHFAYVRRDGRVVRASSNFYQRDAARQLDEHRRALIYLAPGHLKTGTFAIERPTWCLFRDRNWRGTAISKSAPEAAKVVGAVKERLQHTYYHDLAERLRRQGDEPIECPLCAYFPDLPFASEQKDRGAKWGAFGFRVMGRVGGEKDDSFAAFGVGSQILGVRSDYIVLDDVQDPQDAYHSPKDSTDKLEWFRTTVLSRVYDDQQLVVLANRTSPDDFAGLLEREYPDWPLIKYPAILECPDAEDCPGDEACERKAERVLTPEVWTWEGLERKREDVGERTWWYMWRLAEGGDFESRTFRREAMEDARTDDYRLGEVALAITDTFLGVDPAAAASGHAAIISWGLDRRTGQRYLIDIFNETGLRTWGNLIDAIGTKAAALHQAGATFRSCVIEETNTQQTLINDERLTRLIRGMGARVITYKTRTGSGAQARRDSFNISTIGGLFDAGLVSLPYGGTVAEREAVDKYIEQFLAWRVDEEGRSIKHLKRDMVMATLFAESEAFTLAHRPAKAKPRPKPLPDFVKRRFGNAPRWKPGKWPEVPVDIPAAEIPWPAR
jgi:hypothetical protein